MKKVSSIAKEREIKREFLCKHARSWTNGKGSMLKYNCYVMWKVKMGDFELMLRKKIHAVFQAREDKFILMLKMETTLYELTWELEIVKELTMQKRLIRRD